MLSGRQLSGFWCHHESRCSKWLLINTFLPRRIMAASSFMKHYSWTLNSEFNTSNLHFPWMLELNYTWWFRQWLLSIEQMGPFPSSESSLISYPLREGGMMLKTAMQAVESKPRILFEREWKVLAQAPSSSKISLGNKSLGTTAHLPLPFHFLTYISWFVKDGTLPHC